ncbi:MAG: nuclear transport factor 2 family protein [Alphaproteobacteria bacterium]|nr:nuclear transport factor 2 family protein [Alphaproteobacteria bacterium]
MSMPTDADRTAIEAAMQAYFDCLWTGNADLWRHKAFHPQAHMYGIMDGEAKDWPIGEVCDRIDARPSSKDFGTERQDHVLAIDMTSPTSALVKCEVAVLDKYYRDLLTFLKIDGDWKIISKTFHQIR